MRIQDETIARLVPRRNIETWILALNSTAVNETDDYKGSIRTDEKWSELISTGAETFYTLTRPNAKIPEDLIESLRYGVGEMRRVELAR